MINEEKNEINKNRIFGRKNMKYANEKLSCWPSFSDLILHDLKWVRDGV